MCQIRNALSANVTGRALILEYLLRELGIELAVENENGYVGRGKYVDAR